MAAEEEKKEEKKIASVEEIYNNDETLRSMYDLQDGKLVAKAYALKDNNIVPKATTPAAPAQDADLQNALEPLSQMEKSYDQMITDWQTERDRIDNETKAMQQQNSKTQMWGGIAEAASALTNLIGTTTGAVSQKWESPQNKWAERADALRKERDAKLQNYRSQLASLQQAKASISARKASVISAYNSQKETTARTNARIQASADLAIAKAAEAAKVRLAKENSDGLKVIANNANRLLMGLIKENGDMGTLPSSANMELWSDLAYKAALSQYKSLHPDEFEDTILP